MVFKGFNKMEKMENIFFCATSTKKNSNTTRNCCVQSLKEEKLKSDKNLFVFGNKTLIWTKEMKYYQTS